MCVFVLTGLLISSSQMSWAWSNYRHRDPPEFNCPATKINRPTLSRKWHITGTKQAERTSDSQYFANHSFQPGQCQYNHIWWHDNSISIKTVIWKLSYQVYNDIVNEYYSLPLFLKAHYTWLNSLEPSAIPSRGEKGLQTQLQPQKWLSLTVGSLHTDMYSANQWADFQHQNPTCIFSYEASCVFFNGMYGYSHVILWKGSWNGAQPLDIPSLFLSVPDRRNGPCFQKNGVEKWFDSIFCVFIFFLSVFDKTLAPPAIMLGKFWWRTFPRMMHDFSQETFCFRHFILNILPHRHTLSHTLAEDHSIIFSSLMCSKSSGTLFFNIDTHTCSWALHILYTKNQKLFFYTTTTGFVVRGWRSVVCRRSFAEFFCGWLVWLIFTSQLSSE